MTRTALSEPGAWSVSWSFCWAFEYAGADELTATQPPSDLSLHQQLKGHFFGGLRHRSR